MTQDPRHVEPYPTPCDCGDPWCSSNGGPPYKAHPEEPEAPYDMYPVTWQKGDDSLPWWVEAAQAAESLSTLLRPHDPEAAAKAWLLAARLRVRGGAIRWHKGAWRNADDTPAGGEDDA